jgi:hypothetical protein
MNELLNLDGGIRGYPVKDYIEGLHILCTVKSNKLELMGAVTSCGTVLERTHVVR